MTNTPVHLYGSPPCTFVHSRTIFAFVYKAGSILMYIVMKVKYDQENSCNSICKLCTIMFWKLTESLITMCTLQFITTKI